MGAGSMKNNIYEENTNNVCDTGGGCFLPPAI
jgi:hypothetical protein